MPARSRPRAPSPPDRLAAAAVAVLFASPAIIIPGALDRFVFGKLAVAAAGAALAFSATTRSRLDRRASAIVGAGALVLLLAALTAASPAAGLLGRAPRYEGILVLPIYLAAAAAGARLLGPGRDERVLLVGLRVLASVALLIAAVAICESAGLRPLSSNVARPGSLLGNASDEGAFGVLALGPLAVTAVKRRDLFLAGAAIASATTTVLSASRGAMAALLVELLVMAVVIGGRRVVAAAATGAVVIAGFAFAVPAPRHRILDQTPLAHGSVSGRELLWRESLRLDAHHLGLGVGPSNYETAITMEHDLRWQRQVGPADPPDSAHNWLLQATAAGGVPLLLLAVLLAIAILVGGWQATRRTRAGPLAFEAGAYAGVVGYGVVLLAHLTSAGPMLLAGVLTGPLLAQPLTNRSRHHLDRLVAVGVGLLALVMVAAGIAEIPLRHAIVALEHHDPAVAESDFNAVSVLRPWDVDLPDTAAHAFVTVALDTVPPGSVDQAALADASKWLGRVPGSLDADEQVRLDTASLDEARRDYPAATAVLNAALARDRANPLILLRRGVVAAEAHQYADAERDFVTVTTISTDSPEPWRDLATLYGLEGNEAAARHATERANALSR